MPDAGGTIGGRARRHTRDDSPSPTAIGPIPGASAPGWSLRIGRAFFVMALLTVTTMRGGVAPVTLLATVVLIGVALALGTLSPPAEARTLRSFRLSLVVAATLALYLLFQAWSYPDNPFANPLWSRVDRFLGSDAAAISVAPAVTRDAIFTLVAPFLYYAAALALFPQDEGGLRLLRGLAALGVAFAAFGILQVTLFPDLLVFATKTAYLESLTGFFVNRNTAGTFLGVASFTALTMVLLPIRLWGRDYSLVGLFRDPGVPGEQKVRAVARLSGLFLIVLALFLTRSRGAILATAGAYFVVSILLVVRLGAGRSCRVAGARPRASFLSGSLVKAAVVIGVVLLVVLLFGDLAIWRMETRGVDDDRMCVYWSTLQAFSQNWLFGTGFGTFEFIFPLYRSADCIVRGEVFLRAHNVYLEGMLGLGVSFLPLMVGGIVHIVGNLLRGLRRRRRMRAVSLIALGALGVVCLHALVDFSIQIPGMAAYFAAYLGAVTTISLARGPSPGGRGGGTREKGGRLQPAEDRRA